MKKISLLKLLSVAIFVTATFTSCDEPDISTVTIRANDVQGIGTGRIATVEAVIYDNFNDRVFIVGEASFQNRGFNMRLATDIPSSFLIPLYDTFESGVRNLSISNRSANVARIWRLEAFDRDGNFTGFLVSVADTNTAFYEMAWYFVDSPVTVRGTIVDERENFENFDLNLRRGWNVVFVREEEGRGSITRTYTTRRPNNVDFWWNFWNWNPSVGDLTTTSEESRSSNSIFTRR